MATKVIPLEQLKIDPEGYLRSCHESGEPLVVELPDHRMVSIQRLEDDDDLVNDLIATNSAFQALLAKSLSSPRKPFQPLAGGE
jgi:hypothetical protein